MLIVLIAGFAFFAIAEIRKFRRLRARYETIALWYESRVEFERKTYATWKGNYNGYMTLKNMITAKLPSLEPVRKQSAEDLLQRSEVRLSNARLMMEEARGRIEHLEGRLRLLRVAQWRPWIIVPSDPNDPAGEP